MKKFIVFIVISTLTVSLIMWTKINSQQQSLLITSEQVSEQVLSESILASGNLIFNTQIQIRSEVTGIVTDVLVEEGEYVDKNQVLLQLDQTAFKADVANKQAAVNAQKIEIEYITEQYREIQRQLAVKKKLYQQKLVGFDDLQQFNSQVNVAKIKVKAAQERLNQTIALLAYAQDRLNKTTFTAAMPGLISAVNVKTGETVIAGTTNIVGSALMTLADPKTILAELRVDEADIINIQEGMPVEVFSAASPKTPINGDVISIGTSARRSTNNGGLYFPVKVLINESKQLYPGMSCRAEIITAQTDKTLSVPIASVFSTDENSYVWVIENNKARKQQVEVGMATDTRQQVNRGLSLDSIVVTGPSRIVKTIQDGSALRQKKDS